MGFYAADAAVRSIEAYYQSYIPRYLLAGPVQDDASSDSSIGSCCSWPPAEEAICSITDVPGKGLGVVARLDIPRGSRIVCERPFLTIPAYLPVSAILQEVKVSLKAFSKTKQREFFSFHNACVGAHNPLVGIFCTNRFRCGPESCMFTTVSRLTHSCIPNSVCKWNPEEGHMTVHAIRPIQAGEVITIMYLTPIDSSSDDVKASEKCSMVDGSAFSMVSATSDVRQQRLMKSFGFECDCPICSQPPSDLWFSDLRRRRMQRNPSTKYSDYGDSTKDAKTCLAACRRLHDLLWEEYGGEKRVAPYIHAVFADAFKICIAHGDEVRAAAFAELRYQALLICEGDDSPTVAGARHLSQYPEEANMYLDYGTGWESDRTQIPTWEFEDEEVLSWVWREGKYNK